MVLRIFSHVEQSRHIVPLSCLFSFSRILMLSICSTFHASVSILLPKYMCFVVLMKITSCLMQLSPHYTEESNSRILSEPAAYREFLQDAFRAKNKCVRKNLAFTGRYDCSQLAFIPDKKAFQVPCGDYVDMFCSL